MGREDAGEEVRRARVADELEEAREGVLRRALAARDVGLLSQTVQRERPLEEGMRENVRREQFDRPDNVGISEVGEEVVCAELGFIWRWVGFSGESKVVVELVQGFEDWPVPRVSA